MDIVILIEKYCDLNPSLGVTSAHANVMGSIATSGFNNSRVFHYDEYLIENNKPIDDFLVDNLSNQKPDALFVSYYPFRDSRNVKLETFQKIKNMGIPVIFIWFDFGHKQIRDLALEISHATTKNIIVDVYENPTEKFLPMWVPQDERIFCFGAEKHIDVCFVGSTYPDRKHYLDSLGSRVYISGGQREHRLTINQYAEVLRRSKISLNFPHKPDGIVQAKSRIYETMLCGSLLMERENEAIKKWFVPYVHYVPFTTEQDMSEKINYYLTHEDKRITIVENAHKIMTTKYSSSSWWEKVLS